MRSNNKKKNGFGNIWFFKPNLTLYLIKVFFCCFLIVQYLLNIIVIYEKGEVNKQI